MTLLIKICIFQGFRVFNDNKSQTLDDTRKGRKRKEQEMESKSLAAHTLRLHLVQLSQRVLRK